MDLRLTFVNPAVTRQRGYSVEEALAQPAGYALTPRSFEAATTALANPLTHERLGFDDASWSQTLELEMVRKDGSTLWVEANIAFLRDERGQVVGLVGVSRDISGRHQAEWALRESERWFRLLAENVTDVIWTTDMNLRLTYVSPSVSRLWGYTVVEAMALSPGESLTTRSLDTARRALIGPGDSNGAKPAPSFSVRTLELPFSRKDGSTAWTETSVRLLHDHDGRPVGILGVSRDITERRQVEEMKADFVSLTTHQLRTPLTGIKWLLELAAGDAGISEKTRVHIQDAEAAANRLIEIVNNLLDSANLESGTLNVTAETTDLGRLTRSVLDELDPAVRDKRCLVSVAGSGDIGTVMADPTLLRQAILNLVSNAVKYTPPGGRIAIRMRREPALLRWEVEDTGIGVPREARPRLFQKFYRADNACTMAPEGTGLGLYLARLIVERFGGRLWYESEEDRGSTFGFTLPLEA